MILEAVKENVSTEELKEIIESNIFPKPRWMLNDHIYDNNWLLADLGSDLTEYETSKIGAKKFSFDIEIHKGVLLTEKENNFLLRDIQNSILYLNIIGKIKRTERIPEAVKSIIKLIYNANENRALYNKPIIRSLDQITFEDLKNYLNCFNIDEETFLKSIEIINKNNYKLIESSWNKIKEETNIPQKKLETLKTKVQYFFKNTESNYKPTHSERREFQNSNIRPFSIDINLNPSKSTISNELSKLNSFFISNVAQKHKFNLSPLDLIKDGSGLFEKQIDKIKTPLPPVNSTLHLISKSIEFCHLYGEDLRFYINDLYSTELERIKELNIAISTSRKYYKEIKEFSFENTEIPENLKKLKINSWLKSNDGTIPFKELRNELSISNAVRLYTAAIWILISSFTSARLTSILNLKRDCFVHSPIDGLYDIVLKIPKSSERFELEDVNRPIPDIVYDFGLEFGMLVNDVESKRNFFEDESKLYLFGRSIAARSISHNMMPNTDNLKLSLSDDYIKESIDMFVDWCEAPVQDGKRWYPSIHQSRRFFAVLYFHFSDQEGLEELSWFMGHSNLDQTFHYAELSPDDEWIEEAEATIARIGANLTKKLNADKYILDIVERAREKSEISNILEPLVRDLISKHKEEHNKEVRFKKIDNQEIFFYFIKK